MERRQSRETLSLRKAVAERIKLERYAIGRGVLPPLGVNSINDGTLEQVDSVPIVR